MTSFLHINITKSPRCAFPKWSEMWKVWTKHVTVQLCKFVMWWVGGGGGWWAGKMCRSVVLVQPPSPSLALPALLLHPSSQSDARADTRRTPWTLSRGRTGRTGGTGGTGRTGRGAALDCMIASLRGCRTKKECDVERRDWKYLINLDGWRRILFPSIYKSPSIIL